MSREIKNTLLYLLPSLVGAIFPIISLPVFTRILTPDDYGALALCQAYAIFVTSFSNFGLNLGYERNFFEETTDSEGGLLYTSICFVLSTYLLFGLITIFFSGQLTQFLFKKSEFNQLLTVTYFATGMTALKSFYLIYFKNKGNAKKYVWYTLDESILSFLLSLILVGYFRIGVLGIVLAQLMASGVVFLLLTIYFLKHVHFSINIPAFNRSLKISLPLTPRIFFGIIGTQFDKYILGVMSSIGVVGIYSIAQKITTVIFTFMTAVQNVWSPNVYKLMFDKTKDGREFIGSYLTPFFYLSTSAGFLIALFSEEILFFLAPKEYNGAGNVIIVLSVLYCSYFFGKQNQLIYVKKTYLISILTMIGIMLNVVFNYWFVSYWGLMGVAFGSLLSGLISGLLAFVISQHYYKIKWDYRRILIISLVYVGSISLVFLMNEFDLAYKYKLGARLIFVALYVYIGYKENIISADKWISLKKYFTSKIGSN